MKQIRDYAHNIFYIFFRSFSVTSGDGLSKEMG